MRQIKFRALAVVNDRHNNIKVGDFVYGHYIESGCDAPCIIFGDGEQIEVNKETLGQLVGLIEKNGADIYEGDIIHASGGDFNEWTDPVEYSTDKSGFVCDGEIIGYYEIFELEVIGNIHQNREVTNGMQ